MFRRSVINQVYFDPDLKVAEDFDLWLKISSSNKIAFMSDILAYYRRHETSIMHIPHEVCYKAIVLEKNRKLMMRLNDKNNNINKSDYTDHLSEAWFSHGYMLFHTGKNYRGCLVSNVNSLRYRFFKLACWKYIIASICLLPIRKIFK
jgi:hypothetical protein